LVTKRVFLAIAHNAYREAVAKVLNGEPDFEVVAQAGSLSEVGDVELDHHNPDIALVDLSLPESDRLVIVREVSKRDVANAIVLVSPLSDTNDTNISMVEQALEAGAVGVISTSSSLTEVVEALRK
jgi:two-component system, NarL family, nitrate/nitrite response regulator NarL